MQYVPCNPQELISSLVRFGGGLLQNGSSPVAVSLLLSRLIEVSATHPDIAGMPMKIRA
jgi:hypothetical protein